jgi:hypothetical protein
MQMNLRDICLSQDRCKAQYGELKACSGENDRKGCDGVNPSSTHLSTHSTQMCRRGGLSPRDPDGAFSPPHTLAPLNSSGNSFSLWVVRLRRMTLHCIGRKARSWYWHNLRQLIQVLYRRHQLSITTLENLL